MNDLFDRLGLDQPPFPETPAFKLARSRDPSTSHDAADKLDVNKMERIVLAAITSFGSSGCISDDVLNILPAYRYSTVTARYKQLKEKGFVLINDEPVLGAGGCMVNFIHPKSTGGVLIELSQKPKES